jgi:hypothetical protein
MQRRTWIGLLAFGLLMGSALGAAAEENPVTGSANLGVFSKYIFRGYELSDDSVILQPGMSLAYKGFSASFWGNIDSDEHGTQSFTPDRPGRKSFNETDLTLAYSRSFGPFSLTGGYIYYGTKYASETEEIFGSVSYDTYGKPTFAVYRDITSYPGTYLNLSLSHSLKVWGEITLDLGASAGYFAGSSNYWKTYESSTGGYTGKKYSAFHDGMLLAGLTFPIGKFLAVQPVVQYWFPLSSEAKRKIDGNSYNPNGYLDDNLVFGVNAKFSF